MSWLKTGVPPKKASALLKAGDGRATFLIHSDAQGMLFEEGAGAVNEPGLTPLRDAIKVLNGFGRSLEAILPKLRHSYLVEDAERGAAPGSRATPTPISSPPGASASTTPR